MGSSEEAPDVFPVQRFLALVFPNPSLIAVKLAVLCGRIVFPLALPVSLPILNVIGAGLAGSEAAFALARRGVRVRLHEMRPVPR